MFQDFTGIKLAGQFFPWNLEPGIWDLGLSILRKHIDPFHLRIITNPEISG
jgi:hypothetical protein